MMDGEDDRTLTSSGTSDEERVARASSSGISDEELLARATSSGISEPLPVARIGRLILAGGQDWSAGAIDPGSGPLFLPPIPQGACKQCDRSYRGAVVLAVPRSRP